MTNLDRWTDLVTGAGLDGWLVADFRWNNPLFGRLLDLHHGTLSRRAFLWLPARGHGEPRVMASQVDGHAVSVLDCEVTLYAGLEEMVSRLSEMLPQGGTIAMEYVERGVLPTVSRVDAGFVELVRSLGVTVASSGQLISALEVWDERQRSLHERAARGVDAARARALQRCGEMLRAGEHVTERTLADVILRSFADDGLEANHDPAVAVNAHAADPHYGLDGAEGSEITADSVVLIDLVSKARDAGNAPFADSTWMSYTGDSPPSEVLQAFEVVRAARDAAIAAIDEAARTGREIRGREVDRVARASIDSAGLLDRVLHRTGHSLGTDHVHGMGTNLDDVEFPDDRPLLPGSGVTVEPGLYWPGKFGMRLEVSSVLLPDRLLITTERQDELTLVR